MVRNKTKTDRKNALIIWRSIIAALVIMSLIVARQAIMQNTLTSNNNLTSISQVAGEQQVLSQRIMKDTYRLYFAVDVDRSTLAGTITSDLDQWAVTQDQLMSGSSRDVTGIPLSANTSTALTTATISLHSMSEALAEILRTSDPTDRVKVPDQELYALDILSQNYLLEMDRVIGAIEYDISQQTGNATILELVLFLLLILCVMTLIVFVLLPDQKKIYQSYEQVRQLGERDRVTDLLNQFSFHEHIATDMKTKKKHGFTLLLIDIDGFSSILQKKGQLISDDVLRRTASVVSSLLREGDYAARLSSDSFAIVLHVSDDDAVQSFAKSLMRDMSALDIPIVGRITVCLGISKYHTGEPLIDLLDRANRALQQAKQEGRGRVVFELNLRDTDFMGTIKWSDQWNSGHPLIDEQHKMLIQLGNELINEALPTGDIAKEEELLEKVIREMINHFVCEEKIMREIEFPETTAHEITHEILIAKAFEMEQEFLKKNLKAGFVFNFVVEEIIVGHIATEDVKYFPYLKKPEGETTSGSDMEKQSGK